MQSVIRTEKLSKRYGDFLAVDEITFEVMQGEIFGFLGANGAGKTTAMRMLIGLLKPSSGKGFVAGFDIYSETEMIKRNIGYMSQKFSLYEDLTVMENIRFFGGIYGLSSQVIRDKSAVLIEKLGLRAERDKLVSGLPLGWRQKLAFSVAVLHEPKIVFLDEPTGGVDPLTRRQFWDMIYAETLRGMTVFVTTHYMDEAEYCNRVSIMVDGRMKALGSPSELRSEYKAESMDELFYMLARQATRTDSPSVNNQSIS